MLIIFDCDGVLVDSEPLAARELQRYLKDIAFPVQVAEGSHDRFLGLTLKTIRKTLEAEADCRLPKDFEEELRCRDKVVFSQHLKAIPGILEALVSMEVSKCVASSGSQDKIRNSLSLTGLLDSFAPYLFSADDPGIERGKPAPDLFENAAMKMGFSPNQCIVVEDSVAGVTAGLAAGMYTIGFTGGSHCGIEHEEKLRLAGAHKTIPHMASLPPIVNAKNS